MFSHSNHSENKVKTSSRSSHYLNVRKLLRLNTHHFKLSLFLAFISVFLSLNCNMNGLHCKHFSEEVMLLRCVILSILSILKSNAILKSAISSVVKNNWNRIFSDFIGSKKQVSYILPYFTKVAEFVPFKS